MFQQFFQPDNFIFRVCGKIFDLVVLSALWAFCSLPVFTAGAASAALYYAVVKCVRYGEPDPYRNFLRSFRLNFKTGAAISLLAAAAGALLWLGWLVLSSTDPGDTGGVVMRTAYAVALVVPLGTLLFAPPLLSRFDFHSGGLLSTALRLALRHLPSTAVLVILAAAAAKLCLLYWVPVLFLPALTVLLASAFVEPVLHRYTPAPSDSSAASPEEEAEKPWYLR